jgi:hypothetical protein
MLYGLPLLLPVSRRPIDGLPLVVHLGFLDAEIGLESELRGKRDENSDRRTRPVRSAGRWFVARERIGPPAAKPTIKRTGRDG